MALFERNGLLRLHVWLRNVQITAADIMIRTSFIGRCKCGMFSKEWNSSICIQSGRQLLRQKLQKARYMQTLCVRWHHKIIRCCSTWQTFLCRIARQTTILAYMRTTSLIHCQSSGLMRVETHRNNLGWQWFMAAKDDRISTRKDF